MPRARDDDRQRNDSTRSASSNPARTMAMASEPPSRSTGRSNPAENTPGSPQDHHRAVRGGPVEGGVDRAGHAGDITLTLRRPS